MNSSTVSSRPSVSSRVDSNSVQSQFASLTRSRDALRQQLHRMESDRRRHERDMTVLQQKQTHLSSQTQVLHEALGKHRMKRVLLVTEQGRLTTLMAKERQQLEVIGREMQEIATASTQSKQRFCKELQHVSESMEDLLQKHEDKHWCDLLLSNSSSNSDNNNQNNSTTIQILENFIESRAGGGAVMNGSDEWKIASNKVQEYKQLHVDMMTELEALRQQAKQVDPVSAFSLCDETLASCSCL
mmetsp:Transcript_25344/g.42107  ORF Transcript_25344/g.42107 Transcript_25344/m.42107 type:complete len:243 (-) Transcript_25344:499-1227(-)